MKRVMIQIDPERQARLAALAAERGVSFAELVRQGMDRVLAEADRTERWRRFLAAAGKFRDLEGCTDVAVDHDEYIVRAIEERIHRRGASEA